jgi:hypothetical protein
MLLEGFTRSEIKTSGARIVTVTGGKGPPVLLMHGNPFNHLNWHKVAPTLAREFTVVATDLRGYGDSEKPPSSEDHSGYSFRAMAQDQIEVMASLGFDRSMPPATTVARAFCIEWAWIIRKRSCARQSSTLFRNIISTIISTSSGPRSPGIGSSISNHTIYQNG